MEESQMEQDGTLYGLELSNWLKLGIFAASVAGRVILLT